MAKCNYIILSDKKLIIRYFHGPSSFGDLVKCVNATGQDSQYDPSYNVINDFREAGPGLKIKELNEIFGYIRGNARLYSKRKSAFIIKTHGQPVFRMMSGLLKREDNVSIQTFISIEESVKWIGLPATDVVIIENYIEDLRKALLHDRKK
jgi:hypothetical protein